MSKTAVKAVVNAVQKFYPLRLADKSWDNTGLLVDASNEHVQGPCRVLLAIDLTQAVAEEAVVKKAGVILAYHPFIFRGLKSITTEDPQQRSLIKLIKNEISVYCPHTAVDSAKGGVNDFLADVVSKNFGETSREPIQPDAEEKDCGMGRLITLAKPASLEELVANTKLGLNLDHVQVAMARNQDKSHQIKTVAVCAGSGSGVFKGAGADLYLTGELSHHEALFLTESGSSLIACNHSNTERAFLTTMKEQLQKELPDTEFFISETDKDPYETW